MIFSSMSLSTKLLVALVALVVVFGIGVKMGISWQESKQLQVDVKQLDKDADTVVDLQGGNNERKKETEARVRVIRESVSDCGTTPVPESVRNSLRNCPYSPAP